MRYRIATLIVAALCLTSCGKATTSVAQEDVGTYPTYIDNSDEVGESPVTLTVDGYKPLHVDDNTETETEATEASTEEVEQEETVSDSNLPQGLELRNNVIYTTDPLDFKGNAARYAAIKNDDGTRRYTDEEALAFAEIDFVRHNDDYDGHRQLLTVSENKGKLLFDYDYKLPEGVYKLGTTLPISHLAVYIDGSTAPYDEFIITADDTDVTYEIRSSMYVHGNDTTFEYIGSIENTIGNVEPVPDGFDASSYTVSKNIVSQNKLD